MVRSEDVSTGVARGRRSMFLRQWGFNWGEIAASVALNDVEMLPPAAELLSPTGTYYADHLSASRHIVTLLWSHTRRGLPAGFHDPDRRLESRLYEVMARLTAVEAAVMKAECLRVRPLHSDRETAMALLDRHVRILEGAVEEASGAVDLLQDVVDEIDNKPMSRDGTPPAAPEKEPAKSLAQDALDQVSMLLKTIQEIVDLLAPKKKHDDVGTLIQNLAKLLASGTKAAIAGAILALIEAIDSDAAAKDIIVVPGPNGEVTIWFRVRKSCLFILDFLAEDDFVYIHKTGKGETPAFATGEPAEEMKKKAKDKLAKHGQGGTAATPVAPSPSPAAPSPAPPAPPPQPAPSPPPPAKPQGEFF